MALRLWFIYSHEYLPSSQDVENSGSGEPDTQGQCLPDLTVEWIHRQAPSPCQESVCPVNFIHLAPSYWDGDMGQVDVMKGKERT